MGNSPEPVVLELASLGREEMGPFLLLGLDKSATKKEIEEHWADRIKWARRAIIKVQLEDINWARDALSDDERRVRADVASINADTSDQMLAQLAERYGQDGGQGSRLWRPLDSEKNLADYTPTVELPETAQVRAAIQLHPVPEEFPAASVLLQQLAEQPLDPWAIPLPTAPTSTSHHLQQQDRPA
ncbi:MAG: hypothetical protein U0840_13320 [Gemmataceae bacterium]